MIRFLHAADLHLDARLHTASPAEPWVIELLGAAPAAAFEAVIRLAEAEHVHVVLLAGDLFHHPEPGLAARVALADGLERLHVAGTRTFVVLGNHDPLEHPPSLPPSVTLFPPGAAAVPMVIQGEELVVAGASHGRRHETDDLSPSVAAAAAGVGSPAAFRVGLLHANLEGADPSGVHRRYAPTTLQALGGTAVDYWALGHVHRHRRLRAGGSQVLYPGCIQGRHGGAGERGPKGVVRVDVEGGRATDIRAVEVGPVRYERISVDLSPVGDGVADVVEHLRRCVAEASGAAAPRPVVLSIELTGWTGCIGGIAELEELRDVLHLPGRCFVERLVDRTEAPLDLRGRARGGDLLGRALARVEALPFDELLGELPSAAAGLLETAAEDDDLRAAAMRELHRAVLAAERAGE